MIKVVKNGHTVSVTRGVYEDIYKPLGYSIVSEKKEIKPDVVKNDIEMKTEVKTNEEKIDKVDEQNSKPSYKRK